MNLGQIIEEFETGITLEQLDEKFRIVRGKLFEAKYKLELAKRNNEDTVELETLVQSLRTEIKKIMMLQIQLSKKGDNLVENIVPRRG